MKKFMQAVLLLQNGVSANSRNESGESPLIFVAKNLSKKEHKRNREKFAKVLLEFGADPNIQDDSGKTALMYAAGKGESDLVLLLLVIKVK
ncbi:ankyrin repeat domain-containing protein 34C-like protein [Leptotrombidium deliense]|uniref:Ankyrin repeat domain-containing protein 34C-like protein n=1 Tax=Leptotrombidium deliense TaxID=299467 RepID=A0A443SQB8_9ACAR|nr:ankyrin repeat domain-containing protein 34C-like protein [Leptotrombidium deliense]